MGEYSKLDRVKMMGTPRKINAIWWNIKINKKLVDMWTWTANKFANFHTRLNRTEIFQKVWGGYFFLEHPVYGAPWKPKIQRHLEDKELKQDQSPIQSTEWVSSFLMAHEHNWPVRIVHTIVHHCNGTRPRQYCGTETVLLIFPFLHNNSTQMWPNGGNQVR